MSANSGEQYTDEWSIPPPPPPPVSRHPYLDDYYADIAPLVASPPAPVAYVAHRSTLERWWLALRAGVDRRARGRGCAAGLWRRLDAWLGSLPMYGSAETMHEFRPTHALFAFGVDNGGRVMWGAVAVCVVAALLALVQTGVLSADIVDMERHTYTDPAAGPITGALSYFEPLSAAPDKQANMLWWFTNVGACVPVGPADVAAGYATVPWHDGYPVNVSFHMLDRRLRQMDPHRRAVLCGPHLGVAINVVYMAGELLIEPRAVSATTKRGTTQQPDDDLTRFQAAAYAAKPFEPWTHVKNTVSPWASKIRYYSVDGGVKFKKLDWTQSVQVTYCANRCHKNAFWDDADESP